MTEPAFSAADVERYYERQTRAFVTLGQGGSEGAIRRAVWAPGVNDRGAAFHYVDDRIAALIGVRAASTEPVRVVDLGCGVGGSLSYLATRLPIRGLGVTVSPLQAELATRRARAAGVADRVEFMAADFCSLPSIAPADVVMAIESFVHAASAAEFFAQCARLVRPGGVLVLCDDFRCATTDPRAAAAIERFCRGWHVNTLPTREELQAIAADAGFVHESTIDLTPYLELGRPRDRIVDVLLGVLGWLPLERTPFAHLVGGSALQTCLKRGWVEYDLVQFRR